MGTEYTYYKLYNKNGDCDEVYIGKTKDFEKRKYYHKRSVEYFDSLQPVHLFILSNGGMDNWDMQVLDTKQCIDESESLKHEKNILNEARNSGEKVLNKNEPFLTPEESKEKSTLYSLRRYYEFRMKNRADQKIYREKNKEKLKEKRKEYYENNKEELKARRQKSPKVYCECCKISIAKSSVSRHLKSAKHYFSSECRIDDE